MESCNISGLLQSYRKSEEGLHFLCKRTEVFIIFMNIPKIEFSQFISMNSIGPRRDKTFLQGFSQSEFQTSIFGYRDKLENWNFTCRKFTYGTFQKANNKGADQTARMRRLVCACVVRKVPKTGHEAIKLEFILKLDWFPSLIKRHFRCAYNWQAIKGENQSILKLKRKRSDWLLAAKCPQAANRFALFWVWDCTQVL